MIIFALLACGISRLGGEIESGSSSWDVLGVVGNVHETQASSEFCVTRDDGRTIAGLNLDGPALCLGKNHGRGIEDQTRCRAK